MSTPNLTRAQDFCSVLNGPGATDKSPEQDGTGRQKVGHVPVKALISPTLSIPSLTFIPVQSPHTVAISPIPHFQLLKSSSPFTQSTLQERRVVKTVIKCRSIYDNDNKSQHPSISHLFPIYFPSISHLFPIYFPSISPLFISLQQ